MSYNIQDNIFSKQRKQVFIMLLLVSLALIAGDRFDAFYGFQLLTKPSINLIKNDQAKIIEQNPMELQIRLHVNQEKEPLLLSYINVGASGIIEDYYLTAISRKINEVSEQTFLRYYEDWMVGFNYPPTVNTFQSLVIAIWNFEDSETRFTLTYNQEKKILIEDLSYDLSKLVSNE